MISSFSPKQSLPAGPAAMKNPTPISTLSTAPPVTQELVLSKPETNPRKRIAEMNEEQ
ncbi:hypothetical protein Pst134EA_023176 [Puccinia striiformis f. sp. tritici]|uniref:hypothetical protein n=1 Tax=Puccinia striiformis f. sp. tritici TaxID=168172 RepID=UPI002007A9B6|nr:hypothetical protein Pst134EA_023176 [Puccinia striiformis f. sp. tritici]KAH9455724.1 hypothetical protein Pst134EA_023176 [Puccinia striiformis f. sp. tritici]